MRLCVLFIDRRVVIIEEVKVDFEEKIFVIVGAISIWKHGRFIFNVASLVVVISWMMVLLLIRFEGSDPRGG